jgi:hypothetical protein
VAVFIVAAAASSRHRAVLAGVATGLVLHFARDIAEGYPGVRLFWPLQDTSWMASYRWFLGMIVVFTAARLVLVSAGLPHTRILTFRMLSRSGSMPRSPDGPTRSDVRRPAQARSGLALRLPARRGPALRYRVRHGRSAIWPRRSRGSVRTRSGWTQLVSPATGVTSRPDVSKPCHRAAQQQGEGE